MNKQGDNCAVQDPKSDTTFNFYPLMKLSGEPVNATDRHFLLSICGSLPKGKCGNDDGNVGACEISSSGQKIVLGVASKKVAFEGEIVILKFGLV